MENKMFQKMGIVVPLATSKDLSPQWQGYWCKQLPLKAKLKNTIFWKRVNQKYQYWLMVLKRWAPFAQLCVVYAVKKEVFLKNSQVIKEQKHKRNGALNRKSVIIQCSEVSNINIGLVVLD